MFLVEDGLSQFISIGKVSPWELVVVIPSASRGQKGEILGQNHDDIKCISKGMSWLCFIAQLYK